MNLRNPVTRNLVTRSVQTPIGALTLFSDDQALVGIYFEDHAPAPRIERASDGPSEVLDAAEKELAAYFAGTSQSFALPTSTRGTELQRAVWAELARIPHGQTRTYGSIARAIGRPRAARAVGSAVARNPLSIVVPCHRVVGASGDLTGFAGGVARKAWLLTHEQAEISTGVVREADPTR